MRTLLLTRNFPPLWGGMERLNWHLAAELARRGPVRVVAPSGAAAHAPAGVEVAEVPGKPLWRFLSAALRVGMREARRFRPDVVLAGSGLTAPMTLAAARSGGALAAAYVHGLDLTVRHLVYRALWLPAIRRLDRVIANSHATANLALAIGVAEPRLTIVYPGVALPAWDETERRALRQRFRAEHDLGERPLLLSVGRLTARKGVGRFVREVLQAIAREIPEVGLVIVGDVPKEALAARTETPAMILEAAKAAGVAENVRILGFVPEAVLKAAFFAADVHVFPVRHLPDDPEGFGMVAVEAAAHGLPTVAYATGGVVDAVAEGISGRLVPPGDGAGFARAVIEVLKRPPAAEGIREFAARFTWPRFGQAVFEALQP
ncbi:glycosyltransferase family 4 protein [Methylothermus subterraneus]